MNNDNTCAGKGCRNPAIDTLKVVVFNLLGDFCKDCAAKLQADGLATELYDVEKKNVTPIPAGASKSEVIHTWEGRPNR